MPDPLTLPTGEDMTLHCNGFSLPESPLTSEQTRQVLRQQAAEEKAAQQSMPADNGAAPLSRQAQREQFYQSKRYQQLRERYPVDISGAEIGGVYTETFTPANGVAEQYRGCVLINFQGGSFQFGSRTNSQLESIPVAALGNINVISVDYRMYPEHYYPAATDDALAVYQALLADYAPAQIGLFGTSSGAQLAAQLVYQLVQRDLPLPAAVAMIAQGALPPAGDSIAFQRPLCQAQLGQNLDDLIEEPYFSEVSLQDPAVNPALSSTTVNQFPPAFLASSSRDLCLSSVIATHHRLQQANRQAELHIWEGLGHFFHSNIQLPETEQLHRRMLRFFTRQLATH